MMESKTNHMFLQLILFIICLPFLSFSQEQNTITLHSPLRDQNTINSPNNVFRLGFFSLPNSTNRYLAVFYSVSEETVIWIANREHPLNDSSGELAIARDGNLELRNGRNTVLWRTDVVNGRNSFVNTSVVLEDSGNLLLRDNSTGTVLWESFSHPSDVFLATFRFTDNTNTNEKVMLSSWRSPTNPEIGNFTTGLEVSSMAQIFTWNNGRKHWRSGPWNGQILIGVQEMYTPYLSGYSLSDDGNGTFSFTAAPGRSLMKITLNSTGTLVKTLWRNQQRSWEANWVAPRNRCDFYGTCGPFGSCHALNSPICSCMRGFEPTNRVEWDSGNWTSGCVRRRELRCNNGNDTRGEQDGFLRLRFTKVPDFAERFPSTGVEECRSRCSGNCSCIAFAYEPNLGCMSWSGSLIDVQRFAVAGIDLYIRLANSELDNPQNRRLVIIITTVIAGFVVICVAVILTWCWMVKRKGKKVKGKKDFEAGQDSTAIALHGDTENGNIEELPLLTFETLANATGQFDESNLLGKGGFGSVYKGILPSGKEIAVKRLSTASGQGNKEFKNEVVVISKLQHRNLVKLVGYCVEKEEKMLVYEYMPNRSLDGCLFDPTHPSQKILDWEKRFSIIKGIGKGLLYLHRDSRLKIIHRDLKPSNILLDEEWNPKISDFGMARIFGSNEDHLNTARVVGTYGYMAPEYATEGQFSEKSDVYSFGVLMLEILSAKKNTQYYNEKLSLSLLGCAWKLWNEDNAVTFLDQTIASLKFKEDIVRCIQTALLCVHEFPNDRPAIQTVLAMLNHEIVELPLPKEPVFADKWDRSQAGTTAPLSQTEHSINELTITALHGR